MNELSVKITRRFAAPRERVFDAFTRQEALQAWFGPEGYTIPSAALDPRPGGSYRIEMRAPDGAVHIVIGEYREVRPPEKLVFTWRWLEGADAGPETLVTLDFAAREGGTELTLLHSGFATPEASRGHESGWASSFVCLAAALAGKPLAN